VEFKTKTEQGTEMVTEAVTGGVPFGLVSLAILIKVAGKRWPVEECFRQGKGQAGLDQHQLRIWPSFHRHTVLSMCALALLAVATARPPGTPAPWAGAAADPGAGAGGQPERWRDTGKLPVRPGEQPPRDMGLIRVTVPEARRLLAASVRGTSAAPGASGDDATRHGPDGTTTRHNSRQCQRDPRDLPGRSHHKPGL
jgi:hypothetical protein